MGLHDTFRTSAPVACPLDGAPIVEWRDDDGGSMLTWAQGRLTPLELDEPGNEDALFGARPEDRLPPFFGLRAHHADHYLSALGRTDSDDVWQDFELVEVTASVLLPGEFWPPLREGDEPTPRFESVRLWRQGQVYPDAVARLAAERARLVAQLPAHGGGAVCRMWDWDDLDAAMRTERKDPAVALILGYPGFVCARHLAEHRDPDAIVLQ